MQRHRLTAISGCAALALAFPAAASAQLTEVGVLPKTITATAPSCTAGPMGSYAREAEEREKKAAQEKKRAEEKKRPAAKKLRKNTKTKTNKKKAKKAGTAARAHSASTNSTTTSTTTTSTKTSASTSTPAATGTEAPCLAVSRTTGFQLRVASVGNPFVLPRSGRIVAWTIQLGRPTSSQIKFFDTNEGGAAEANISVLKPEKASKAVHKLTYKLVAQSPLIQLEPYFGLMVQFPLASTIEAEKGDVVALTVPTWAPALALGYEKDTSWRASRGKAECSVTNTQTAHIKVGKLRQYECLYQTARLTYSATLISTP
jgi:outer membrane biosynthesis protein TonB